MSASDASRLDAEIRGLHGPIVVFGAGGFIGCNLFRRILQVRDDCYAVTHQSQVPWRLAGLPADRVLHADVTSAEDMERIFSEYAFQTIFCLAAFGAYPRQTAEPKIFQTNVMGLVNVLSAATTAGFRALVHGGTSSEYGDNSAGPAESAELRPNSAYAVSKVAASHLLRYHATHNRLPVINLRYYSVYGPWEEPDRLMPRLVEFGRRGDYPPLVAPGTTRDFVYVDDAVRATIRAASTGVLKAPGSSVNIASGRKTSLRELAGIAREVFGIAHEPAWNTMPNRAWDVPDWFGNPSFARELLGWRAEVDLAEGLRRFGEWAKGFVPPVAPRALAPTRPLRLSAVIACYKDAEAIPQMAERLSRAFRSLPVEYEIIFVNDGSPDDTMSVLEGLCRHDPHIVAIEHSRNFGSQSAFLSGMQVATGDGVILLDGDLQDPPELIPQLFERWREGYDVVYGRRVKREASLLLQICYKAFYRVFRTLSSVPIPVDAGDFSLIDRKVVDILCKMPETDQFLRGLRAWVGFRQVGVDYLRPERPFGRSTNNWVRNIRWAKKAIFSFSLAPIEWLSYAGVSLTCLSVCAFVFQIIYRLRHPEIPHGITTIIILVLFFGGLNVFGLSVLGEYIGKILEETKGRPKFIRRRIVRGGKAGRRLDSPTQALPPRTEPRRLSEEKVA